MGTRRKELYFPEYHYKFRHRNGALLFYIYFTSYILIISYSHESDWKRVLKVSLEELEIFTNEIFVIMTLLLSELCSAVDCGLLQVQTMGFTKRN